MKKYVYKETHTVQIHVVKGSSVKESKSWLSEKIDVSHSLNKIKERRQIIRIRSERNDITTDFADIQIIRRKYYEHLNARKLDNLDEMDNSLERSKYKNQICIYILTTIRS